MEMTNEVELKTHLIQTNEQFRVLAQKHSEYDHLLVALEAKHHLTAEEQLEEVRLKKLKLQAKDQMREMMAQYKATHTN